MSNWASLADARELWPDAPLDDDLLGAMIDSAHEVVEAYAPTITGAAPYRYIQAEVLQAQEHYQATQRNGDVLGFGESGFAVRVRPLSASVKALLRPRVARPSIGKLGVTS